MPTLVATGPPSSLSELDLNCAASARFARARLPMLSVGGSARSRHGAAGRAGLRAVLAGRRGSSEDDLPLRLNHAQDLGVGRGLNPAPDEHGPAESEYD